MGIIIAMVVFPVIATWWGLGGLVASLVAAGACLLIASQSQWLACVRPFAPMHLLRTCWSMRPITAILVALAVAAPWYVWVGIRTDGDFLHGFFINEHFGRATTAMENHGGSPFYYPAVILVGFFPWSVFAAPVLMGLIKGLRRQDAWHPGYVLLVCWVGVYIGLFTLAETKLPSYVTPCYPALALLTGCFMFRWTGATSLGVKRWGYLSLGALAMVGICMLIAVPLAARTYLPGDQWLGGVGLIPLFAAAACFIFSWRGHPRQAAGAFAASAVLLAVFIFGFATQRIDRHRQHHVLLEAIAQRTADPQIGYFGPLEPSWVFYGRHPIRGLTHEAEGGCPSPRKKDWHPHPFVDVAAFFEQNGAAFVITTERHLDLLASKLPREINVLAKVPYFLKKENLVLLGRNDRSISTAAAPRGIR